MLKEKSTCEILAEFSAQSKITYIGGNEITGLTINYSCYWFLFGFGGLFVLFCFELFGFFKLSLNHVSISPNNLTPLLLQKSVMRRLHRTF